jgi:hypothetical protein
MPTPIDIECWPLAALQVRPNKDLLGLYLQFALKASEDDTCAE